jgi:hypothetical protein
VGDACSCCCACKGWGRWGYPCPLLVVVVVVVVAKGGADACDACIPPRCRDCRIVGLSGLSLSCRSRCRCLVVLVVLVLVVVVVLVVAVVVAKGRPILVFLPWVLLVIPWALQRGGDASIPPLSCIPPRRFDASIPRGAGGMFV